MIWPKKKSWLCPECSRSMGNHCETFCWWLFCQRCCITLDSRTGKHIGLIGENE